MLCSVEINGNLDQIPSLSAQDLAVITRGRLDSEAPYREIMKQTKTSVSHSTLMLTSPLKMGLLTCVSLQQHGAHKTATVCCS